MFVLGHLFMKRLFSFPNLKFIAFPLALHGIDYIAFFVSWCFVLGFELHWDVVYLEDSPDFFFRNSGQIWD